MGHAVLTKPIVSVNKPQKMINFGGKGGRYMVGMTAVKDPMTFFSFPFSLPLLCTDPIIFTSKRSLTKKNL